MDHFEHISFGFSGKLFLWKKNNLIYRNMKQYKICSVNIDKMWSVVILTFSPFKIMGTKEWKILSLCHLGMRCIIIYIEDLTLVVISYEIHQTSLLRV